ncbi:hypothetical protein ABFS82_04G160600 [Erythranthe guttata]|uniref:putative late blight resistance protein homolog R1A-10 n=1 Tax=Erythranthe guttata TaxID=4155 RepID=UPI00064DEECF|nr:PREDICTED: putative late blight resistance protein homolog R1A-10 [Erythranthe guttata]|eukprot:XP_012852932.1 PREDICTED: putative late blight resistance protein homolog R1A-10 [Erythranthe guttata]
MRESNDEPAEETSKAPHRRWCCCGFLRRRVRKDEETPDRNNDSREVTQEISSPAESVNAYAMELSTPPSDHSDEDYVPPAIDSDENKSNLVGLSDQINRITAMLKDWKLSQLLFVSIFGMTGIGKTTLAKEIFEHPLISDRFHHRVWVDLGPNYRPENVLHDIVAQLDADVDRMHHNVIKYLSKFMRSNTCLVVLDGVWDTEVFNYLLRFLKDMTKNRSAVLVTTTLEQVAVFSQSYRVHQMRLLNEEDSWSLLRHKVFDEMPCPPELVKPGKRIAENCEGLPLTIVTVADLLSKLEKSPECWKKIAEQEEHSVFMDAYEKMSEVLFPNYDYLPRHLKEPFLYSGVFPMKKSIPYSKIVNLWISEGFLEQNPLKTPENVAAECLKDLISRSVVMVHQQSTSNTIKTCRLHSVFWHLCIKEARKNKFFHVVKRYADIVAEDVESQPRFCIHNNVLFGIKDLNNLIASTSNVSSLLCTGPYHQYPVPICLDHSNLLRILDALTVHFYLFPIDVLKLVELRYLSLTYNGNLPSSISKLSNLECLIVGRPLAITSVENPLCLPVEIWDMKKLKHLQFTGSNQVPDPGEGSFLPNLVTLSDISARSCNTGVFRSIPNLKKLGIRIELSPDEATDREPLSCFQHISHLEKLESLKCVVVNPIFNTTGIAVCPPPPLSVFPSGLKKLSLCGLGYPWEEMSKIALLPNLEVLKLRSYAFRGPKWEVEDNRFLRLEFILIEDSDLVRWTAGNGSFPFLECLNIKHCYKLQAMPRKFSFDLGKIQVVDCTPLVVNWAKKLTKIDVRVDASWDDKTLKK